MLSSMAKVIPKRFTAQIEGPMGRLKWVVAYLPFDVKKIWGSGRVRVRGEINGFQFRTSLFPSRSGRHFLLVNKAIQKGARVRPGDTVKVRMENDVGERTATVPPELELELKQSKALRKWFDALSYSMRRYFATQVSQPKSAEARKRRAEQYAELLYTAMDAERDLPPVLRAAFARRPKAYDGWQTMSAIQRKHHLLGIFFPRNLASREKRMEKMLSEAEARAEKKNEE
jgi:uncharacterized protein YdeI (YjbR/CyaY-like superfamily)